jgi:hypothetical protein
MISPSVIFNSRLANGYVARVSKPAQEEGRCEAFSQPFPTPQAGVDPLPHQAFHLAFRLDGVNRVIRLSRPSPVANAGFRVDRLAIQRKTGPLCSSHLHKGPA